MTNKLHFAEKHTAGEATIHAEDASHEIVQRSLFSSNLIIPDKITAAVSARNNAWANNPLIPAWVDIKTVDLDQFFTRPEIARDCHMSLLDVMKADHANLDNYKFVEPAAGGGVFYDLLPPERRVGIEIVAGRPEFENCDFLNWQPPANGRRYAVIGNPPFGYRAWLALAFMNRAASFADYIGMILPMAFQSDGKGSPKHRVTGAQLIKSEQLPPDAFIGTDGQPVSVNALWQIWRRGVNNRQPVPKCSSWVDLFTVDMRKERLCGQNRLSEADWFLQRTFYSEPPDLVLDFSDVKYVCGYGIVIKRNKKQVTACLRGVDWRNYSSLATHNCRHISMHHIRKVLTDAGFVDE